MSETEQEARHRGRTARRSRVGRTAALAALVFVVVASVGLALVYRQLDSNIGEIDISEALGTDRPEVVEDADPRDPLNILLIGSDTREGSNSSIGGETPGLSDTTILLHLSADRERAYGVSLPRDAMVERPECLAKDGETQVPAEFSMFNAAYAVGGAGCTARTVEQLTGIRLDHFVVVDFTGFKTMVDALGGVPVCVPEEVNDTEGNIYLPEGSYEVSGQRALDYVRVRYDISDNGDIGRMKRQQTFLAAMANKAISAGTLTNPPRLYKLLDAATESLQTDPGLASLKELFGLARQLQDIGLDNIQFLTVPFEQWEVDRNRLIWTPAADKLWDRLRNDETLTSRQSREVVSADDATPSRPSGSADPGDEPSASSSESAAPSPSSTEAEAAAAAENGLCA